MGGEGSFVDPVLAQPYAAPPDGTNEKDARVRANNTDDYEYMRTTVQAVYCYAAILQRAMPS